MDISSIFQTWLNVLTKPGEEVFAAEREKDSATLKTALVWIILASVIAALLATLRARIFSSQLGGLGQFVELLPADLQEGIGPAMAIDTAGGTALSLLSIIFGPLSFLISVGIYHLIASVFGGRGQFGRFAYLSATFMAPLMIVSSLLIFVPILGFCLTIFLGIYQVVLTFYATKVEYQLSQGRAIVVVLVPLLAMLLLAACGLAVFFSFIFSTVVSNGP